LSGKSDLLLRNSRLAMPVMNDEHLERRVMYLAIIDLTFVQASTWFTGK